MHDLLAYLNVAGCEYQYAPRNGWLEVLGGQSNLAKAKLQSLQLSHDSLGTLELLALCKARRRKIDRSCMRIYDEPRKNTDRRLALIDPDKGCQEQVGSARRAGSSKR